MKRNNLRIYIFQFLLLLILFFALFVSNIFSRGIFSILISIYMIALFLSLKKRPILSMYKKQVILLMLILAFIYLILFYLLGIFTGYHQATVKLSLWSVKNYIIPFTLIIISSEIIRSVFMAQQLKYSKLFTFIITVIIDLIVYTNVYNLSNLEDFMAVVGFIFFASCSCNLLYNYVSSRFGFIPVIIYKLITVLYVYIIPITPDIYIFFISFIRMVYPYIIYLILEYGYSKSNFTIAYNDKRRNALGITFIFIFMILITMLVSCKFKYGILVIGSGSMTGSINKGDAVVFERYEKQSLKKGDVIIFNKDNLQIVHRIVDIKRSNNIFRYYTKGDANLSVDDGYVIDSEIAGMAKFRISYIGLPTLWLRDLFEN